MRILLAAALTLSTVAMAKPPLPVSERIALEAVHNYARCVVERSPAASAQLLDLDFRAEEYGERMDRFARGHAYCAPATRLGFRGVLLAGALAEHLLEMQYRTDQLLIVLAKVTNPPLQARDETEMMALCTVRTAPAEVADILRQPVASADETRAMQVLAPKLTGCLANGQALRVNRPGLRAVLALAAWRVAKGRVG